MNLLIKFMENNNTFSAGVEYGRLLQKFEQRDLCIQNNGFPIRIENKELIKITSLKYGYIPLFCNEYFNEWIDFVAIKNNTCNN